MPYNDFVYDTTLGKSGSSQILIVPPKFLQITGLKKNSKKQLRVTIQVLIILIALGSMTLAQEESTGIGSLILQIKQNNNKIDQHKIQFTKDLTNLNKMLGDKIDGLFSRVVVAIVGVQLFILGSSKAIGGLAKYIRGRKKTKAVEKNNRLLEEIIPLLVTLNTIEAVKEVQDKKEPKKTKHRFNPYNMIIAGAITIIIILVLNKLGVIG